MTAAKVPSDPRAVNGLAWVSDGQTLMYRRLLGSSSSIMSVVYSSASSSNMGGLFADAPNVIICKSILSLV